MTMNKSSILSESSSSSSLAPGSNHGLRTQLGHILPKHSLFHVYLHIDQLSNVPLVTGEFGARWKFRNVQSGAGLLSKMKNRSSSSSSMQGGKKHKWKGKGRMESTPEVAVERASTPRASYEDRAEDSQHTQADTAPDAPLYGQYLTTSPPATPVPPPAELTSSKTTVSEKGAEARGMTDWAQLKNYTVRWDHRVDVLVQMDVHRETGDLLPCELKLVVMQRVVQGDPNAPHHPRLGAIYLNLAEYAAVGPVTRRYLLRESKTNATLKVSPERDISEARLTDGQLTIDVQHVGGEKNFTPPPLRKGEIMASVTGLLSNNDLYNTKLARNLDMYTRPDDDEAWEDNFERTPVQTYWNADGHVDFDRLVASDGLRTTENLIDAIFNPVLSTSPRQSPFTIYDPEKAQETDRQVFAVERQSTHSSTESCTDASSHSSSAYTAGSDRSSNNQPERDLQKHWWQRMRGSRPSTPSDKHPPSRSPLTLITTHQSRLRRRNSGRNLSHIPRRYAAPSFLA